MPPASSNTKTIRAKLIKRVKTKGSSFVRIIKAPFVFTARQVNRPRSANVLMFCFILFTSIGAGMIFMPAGWVVAGVGCGIFGFLLGLE
jgi:hypothetical protein